MALSSLWFMEIKYDFVHCLGIINQVAYAFSCLLTKNGCTEFIDDDITIQLIGHYNSESFLVKPGADASFELEENKVS